MAAVQSDDVDASCLIEEHVVNGTTAERKAALVSLVAAQRDLLCQVVMLRRFVWLQSHHSPWFRTHGSHSRLMMVVDAQIWDAPKRQAIRHEAQHAASVLQEKIDAVQLETAKLKDAFHGSVESREQSTFVQLLSSMAVAADVCRWSVYLPAYLPVHLS